MRMFPPNVFDLIAFRCILICVISLFIISDSNWFVVDGCGSFWFILGRFGWFLVLVSTAWIDKLDVRGMLSVN